MSPKTFHFYTEPFEAHLARKINCYFRVNLKSIIQHTLYGNHSEKIRSQTFSNALEIVLTASNTAQVDAGITFSSQAMEPL